MPAVLSDSLIDFAAKAVLGNSPTPPNLYLGLFVNNITPTAGNVLADFTECSAPGYARVSLTPGNWTGSTTLGVADYLYPTITFAITGPGTPGQTVYGHFVLDPSASVWWWAQVWTTAWVIPATVTSNPTVTLEWKDTQCSG